MYRALGYVSKNDTIAYELAGNHDEEGVKQTRTLPVSVQKRLYALAAEMEQLGPVRGNWPNYSKLSGGRNHCHLKKGKPTYVAVWAEKAGTIQLVEVQYVGTHEKAPY